jgi:dienelactone hydrolase
MVATFPPFFGKESKNPQAELGLAYEEVAFQTADGLTLRGWFIPAEQAGAPAVLYAPGTGHDQRSGLSLAVPFHRAGYHVLLFSYRGHGQSDGNPTGFTYGEAESRDVDAAVRFLVETKGIHQVAAIGYSAGAASVILSAARNPHVAAVVAVAPYNCVAEVWRTSRPAVVPAFVQDWALWLAEKRKGFDRDQVCPEKVVSQIGPRPLLVIHGTGDQRILETQVRRLFAAASQPKDLWLVAGATHGSIRTPVLDELAPRVIAFLDGALAGHGAQIASRGLRVGAGVREPLAN